MNADQEFFLKLQKHGGFAFPTDVKSGNRSFSTPGMTMRDYFAALAMQSLVEVFTTRNISSTAADAYKIADAMLKAREENREV